jgi:hypothetical protein
MLKCFGVFSELTGFARPMSRLQAMNRPELLLPSLMPDWHQLRVIFDPSAGRVPAPVGQGRGRGMAAMLGSPKYSLPAAKQAIQGTEVTGPKLNGANHLLARLVFQQIRSRSHSGVIGGQSCSSDEPPRGGMQASTPAPRSPLKGRVALAADAGVSVPVPLTVEILFTQLARRRLRSRAKKETC